MTLKRRSFLGMIGAAAIAPAMPMRTAAAPAAAVYNRYMYGLAVFHARTRASLSTGDLMAKLRVSAIQAEALMGKMTATGVVQPIAQSAIGAVRAINPTIQRAYDPSARRLASKLTEAAKTALDHLEAQDAAPTDEIDTDLADETPQDVLEEDTSHAKVH